MKGYRDFRSDDAVTVPDDKAELNRWRVVAAFVLTPFIAALAFATFQPAYDGLSSYPERVFRTTIVYAIFGALLPTIVLGIPAFMALKKVLRPTAVNFAIVGAIIASVPWFFFGLDPSASGASIDGRPTVIGGEYTAYGWQQFGQFLLIIGAAGAVGGVIFWLIAAAKWPRV